jgi:heavy metal sensor kinase
MTNWSIQTRLTLWYGVAIAVSLSILGIGIWWAMRASMLNDVDRQLDQRLAGITRVVDEELRDNPSAGAAGEIQESLSNLPGGEWTSLCDQTGRVLYRSPGFDEPSSCRPASTSQYRELSLHEQPFRSIRKTQVLHGRLFTFEVATPTQHVFDTLHQLRLLLLLSVPLVLLLALAGGYAVSGRALAPVDAIIKTARTVSLQNLSRRLVVPPTGDELQRLSETLNDMLARLEQSFARVTAFTADAAHELRTPLALIRTTAEVALRSGDAQERAAALPDIIKETESMTELVENLLLLARADAGYALPQLTVIPMSSILEDARDIARTLALANGVKLEWPPSSDSADVWAEKVAARRLLLILLDNAIKYTPAGGTVAVLLHAAASEVVIEVKDTGIGIAPDDLPHIFERFYRADKARSRETGGAGLGLSLAAWIADAHKARLTVASEPGRGSTFRIGFRRVVDSSPDATQPLASAGASTY